MKLIKLYDIEDIPLTADNDVITVDNDSITVDSEVIQTDGNTYKIILLPRELQLETKLVLRNERTNEVNELITTNLIVKGYLHVYFTLDNILNSESFQATLFTMNDELLWRGKFFATMTENVQEYTMNPKTNNKIII